MVLQFIVPPYEGYGVRRASEGFGGRRVVNYTNVTQRNVPSLGDLSSGARYGDDCHSFGLNCRFVTHTTLTPGILAFD